MNMRGFTLIELMVVMAIIVVLFALGSTSEEPESIGHVDCMQVR